MDCLIIDGKALASRVRSELQHTVAELTPRFGRAPGLAVVLVGDNPASKVYVASKTKAAHECGIATFDYLLPATIDNAALLRTIGEINMRAEIDGILLQLPLPAGLDEFAALAAIGVAKDVDGLNPQSQGLLLRGAKGFRPCTPQGIMMLIDHASSELGRPQSLAGAEAVVVGRSVLVGKPVGLLLLERHCTVTLAHSRTKGLAEVCRRADILVMAVGKPQLADEHFIKPGAIVIDVGINRTPEGKLLGDVNLPAVMRSAAAITPVPGGVGPMTIAMLLANTVESARQRLVNV